MHKKTQWILIAGLSLALSACSTEPDAINNAGVEDAAAEDPMTSEYEPELNLDESAELARAQLAERLAVAEEAVTILEARRVTWRDGAYGCPEPGRMYTQALVEGFFIVLEAAGKRHLYHAGQNGRPFHCPTERSQEPAPTPSLY